MKHKEIVNLLVDRFKLNGVPTCSADITEKGWVCEFFRTNMKQQFICGYIGEDIYYGEDDILHPHGDCPLWKSQ